MPARLRLGSETNTHKQLHAHMYQKHLDTKTESTYMKPEGNRHSQDPSLIDKALNSQGFLEIYIYIFFRLVHGRRKQKQLCRKTFLSESRAAPAALQWGRLLPTRYIPHGHEDPRPQERKEQAGVCNARNKRTQLPALLTL